MNSCSSATNQNDPGAEERLQNAWHWFASHFFPDSVNGIKAVLDPQHPHHNDFSIITSHWEGAASLVVNGALNAESFLESAGEMFFLWARIGRYIVQLRREQAFSAYLSQVEKIAALAPAEVERARMLDDALPREIQGRDEVLEYLKSESGCFKFNQLAILRDYSAVCSKTLLTIAGICNLELVVKHVIKNRLRGAFVECGTCQGGAIAYWAKSFIRNGGNHKRTKLYGFDSFEGLPRITPIDGERASQLLYGKPLSSLEESLTDGALVSTGHCMADEEECRSLVEASGYHKDSINIVKGWFQDTLPGYRGKIGPIAVLRLDADWYDATMFCLETLYDLVLPNGVVIIDDYEYYDGCKKAVDEFMTRLELRVELISLGDYTGCYFFKPDTD